MKSQDAYNVVICNVCTKYGAPIGRANVGERPTNKRIFKRLVTINRDGYDKGGVYWGIGKPLYVEYTSDLTFVNFTRQ